MSHKIKLNLPESAARTRLREKGEEIWDPIRGRWLILTPEEWVRQQVIGYLIRHKGADPMLIRQEQVLLLYGTSRRADIVVYNSAIEPLMVVECKAPQVNITRQTLEQAVRYNLVLQVPYILITNGLSHYCFRYEPVEHRFAPLQAIPDFRHEE
ncbi:MAG: type I restriction enzyme HsdR N-terminal domain-containing protein [Rikenellaceae bacterium]|nr:type I restriction enzyme HsdR N-terminal domain-containing protein [Rikenellaceae bacterium]